jgi:tripartite-type tricarboxylate transporter receptor subunit TctC
MNREMSMTRRRHYLLAALSTLAGVLALPQAAEAQPAWPAAPVKIVVAYPPGGSTDVAARLIAERLSTRFGQQVVVENRAGAGGTIGAASVAKAQPDGYTLLFAASPELTISRITRKDLPYDASKDLKAITLVGTVPFLLVANPGVPANDLKSLIAWGKTQGDRATYASFGQNTSNHLVGELFKAEAGLSATHVPYKGSAPAVTDLIGGQVSYMFDTVTAVLPHVKAGKLKPIAIATPQRSPLATDVPTMNEAGLANFTGGTWFGLLAPAGTPAAVTSKLHSEVSGLVKSPEISQNFESRGIVPVGGTPAEFEAFITSEIAKWQTLATRIGIKAE